MTDTQNFQGQPYSAIEATWPQNETIAEGILQYLNLHDVWNMRKTSKTMNMLLKGHRRPNNANTTLSFIAARCNECRNAYTAPWRRPCTNGPQADVLMKYCEVANRHGDNQGGPFNLCQKCLNHNHQLRDESERETISYLWMSACKTCQDDEENAFPWGRNTCTCKAEIRGEWKCDLCCRMTMREIKWRGLDRARRLPGSIIRPCGSLLICEGCRCGRTSAGDQILQTEVMWCLSCEGVIVAPSNNPTKGGKVITRRSERLKRKREEQEDVKRGKKKVV